MLDNNNYYCCMLFHVTVLAVIIISVIINAVHLHFLLDQGELLVCSTDIVIHDDVIRLT